MKKIIIILLCMFVISGCRILAPVQRIEYNEADFAHIKKTGTGVVTGQIFMKTRGGDVKFGAGNEITLNPVTKYSQQWYDEAYLKNKQLSKPDPGYLAHVIYKITDGSGKFTFKNVPPGEYFCVGEVFWEVPNALIVRQGGLIAKKITVENNKEIEVILTR